MPLLNAPLPNLVPFTASIAPLSAGDMGRVSVAGPLAFSMAANPLGSYLADVELVADGVHAPTFPGMTQAPLSVNSLAYNNTAGLVHAITFSWDYASAAATYTITSISASAIPAVTGLTLAHGSNPVLTISVGGASLNTEFVPPASTFSLTLAPTTFNSGALGVKAVSVSANQVQLALVGKVNAGDTVTLSYAADFPGVAPYGLSAQDASGNLLAALIAAPVTVT